MSEDHPVLKGLMRQAFDRLDEAVDYPDHWIRGLDEDEATAVHFGTMNYQVENGGWPQWVGNDYADLDVIQFIENRIAADLEQTPDVINAGLLLEEAKPHLYTLLDRSSRLSSSSERDENEAIMHLTDLSYSYYKFNAGLLRAVENYLVARQAQPASV